MYQSLFSKLRLVLMLVLTRLEAQLYHIETGDPTLGIYVLPTRAQAEAMLDPDGLIAAASA